TGNKNVSARSNFVTLDQFLVWPNVTSSVSPTCASCHADKTAAHGADWDHTASKTAGLYSGYTCNQCHRINTTSTPSGDLWQEHGRASSSSNAQGCAACHPTYAPESWTASAAAGGCSYGTCHTVAPRQSHTASATAHLASTATADALCTGACHSGALNVVHNNSITYNNGPVTNCLTCHTTTLYPSTDSCTGACHTRRGATTNMVTHIEPSRPSHVASATDASISSTNTGGFACSTCHLMGSVAATALPNISDEHAKGSSVTSASGSINCDTCHRTSYFPTGWNDKCTACHATGKAGVPHRAYTTKHDFSLYSAMNNTSCGTVNGPSCHNVTMADVIHTSTAPGAANCTSCHISANSVPTQTLCTDCHGVHAATAHDGSVIARPANSECVPCHSGYATISTGHKNGCASCHANATLVDYLKNNYTSTCSDCHASGAGKVGTHAYTPANANHSTGADTPTHTAVSMNTTLDATYSYDVQCQSCHSATLKSAHTTMTPMDSGHAAWGANSTTAFCVGCHTSSYAEANSVSVIASGWPTRTCDECHVTKGNGKHATYSTAHTATVGTAGTDRG
ncbi:MAG: hypothetical protein FDZ75_02875, partial [Actinobacteria bacterium]